VVASADFRLPEFKPENLTSNSGAKLSQGADLKGENRFLQATNLLIEKECYMAVTIRLTRMGAKKKPFYRLVVADSRFPRDGRFIEVLGTYDPNLNPPIVNLDREKVQSWVNRGANLSNTVRSLLKKGGISVQPAKASATAAKAEGSQTDSPA
jgi:small subunit ribosomal protein S16